MLECKHVKTKEGAVSVVVLRTSATKEVKLYDATNDEDVLLYFEDKEITL